MSAERNRDLQVVEMREGRSGVWRADVKREIGLQGWKIKKEVINQLKEERRERQERLMQLLFCSAVSGLVGAALYRVFVHLH
jgi:hypothetical protein